MILDVDSCYQALRARDRRFDGVFFVGVKTTGVYCRPICPARLPGRDRCEFFCEAVQAEQAGYRACLRCRPELAPGDAAVDARPRLARAAATRIEAGYLNDHSLEELAVAVGVTPRHLRRVLEAELGATPVELAQTRRLALAKQLLHETQLSMTEVAFAAGFASVRRFNALFRRRFGRPPSTLRRDKAGGHPEQDAITLRLDYRPPFDWPALLAFLQRRALPGVETAADGVYQRFVELDGCAGWVAVQPDAERPALSARVALTLAPRLMQVVARLRALFDLDARPELIAAHLRDDALLRPLIAQRPGLRVPGAFDGFELAVRAVLGQQVSVDAATTVGARLVARFGRTHGGGPVEVRSFPRAARLAAASVGDVAELGMPSARARTVVELARRVACGSIDLSLGTDAEFALEKLVAIPGIGAWTAHYVALRALRWPDAFPASDLVLRAALGGVSERAAEQRSLAWRPWRAYAVMHLWHGQAQKAQKTRKKQKKAGARA